MTPMEIRQEFERRATASQRGYEAMDTHAARDAARALSDMGSDGVTLLDVVARWSEFTDYMAQQTPPASTPGKPDIAFIVRHWRAAGAFLGRQDIATAA
jgi:hypothetical protein